MKERTPKQKEVLCLLAMRGVYISAPYIGSNDYFICIVANTRTVKFEKLDVRVFKSLMNNTDIIKSPVLSHPYKTRWVINAPKRTKINIKLISSKIKEFYKNRTATFSIERAIINLAN